MKTLPVVLRIENDTDRPILFFNDAPMLGCYTREEQHSHAVPEYMRDNTHGPKNEIEQAQCDMLLRHYRSIGPISDYVEPVPVPMWDLMRYQSGRAHIGALLFIVAFYAALRFFGG